MLSINHDLGVDAYNRLIRSSNDLCYLEGYSLSKLWIFRWVTISEPTISAGATFINTIFTPRTRTYEL